MSNLLKKTLLLVGLLATLRVSLSQEPDCSAVEEDTGGMGIRPAIVPDLAVCPRLRDRLQCCTSDYLLERVSQIRLRLLEGIRAEVRVRRERIDNITERFSQFVEGTFLDRLFDIIDIDIGFERDGTSVFGNLIAELRDRFEIGREEGNNDDQDVDEDDGNESFDVRNFFERVVQRVRDEAVMEFDRAANKAECIRNVISSAVDNTKMAIVSGQIQRLRQVVTTIRRIARFFQEFQEDLAGFRPLEQCVTRLTDLLYCGRCIETTPPLCRNLCGALARGCYSPVYGGLRQQFQRVLRVASEVLQVARDAIMTLEEECNITITLGRKRKQTDGNSDEGGMEDGTDDGDELPDIPDDIEEIVDALTGVYEYGDEGPLLCVNTSIITRRRDCWDGEGIRMQDIPNFEGNDINDQEDNPAIELEMQELEALAAELLSNNPASALLSDPGFVEVVPEGVDLTDPAQQTGDGASTLAVSQSLTLLLMLIAILAVSMAV